MSADIRQDNNTSRTPVSQKGKQIKAADGTADFIGGQVSVTIDGHALKVPLGTTILDAAKKLGIKIPTLCHHPDLCVAGVCRVCVVEVENQRNLQASCAYPITAPLKVHTHTKKVRQARRHVLDLLLSEHYGECYSCVRNNNCELQALANEYGVDFYRFGHVKESRFPIDASSYSVVRDMDKCVLCRRCVRTCIDVQEVGALEAAGRGTDHAHLHLPGQAAGRRGLHQLRAVHQPLPDRRPARQGRLGRGLARHRRPEEARRHPDGAEPAGRDRRVLRPAAGHADDLPDEHRPAPRRVRQGVRHELHRRPHHHRGRHRAAAAAAQGPREEGAGRVPAVHAAARRAGSSTWSTSTRSTSRTCRRPRARSRCSAPSSRPTTRSRTSIDPKDIVTVALMPCSAKKFECNRPEMDDSGFKDVDYGLTTRELAQMIKEAGIHLPDMPKSDFDEPFGDRDGFRGDLRRDRRRHGGGPADGDRAGHRPEGREPVRERQHRPGARLRRRAVRGAAGAGGEPDGGAAFSRH